MGIRSAMWKMFRPVARLSSATPKLRVVSLTILVILVATGYRQLTALWATQQQCYNVLEQTYNELKELRSSDPGDADWNAFRDRSLGKLMAFVPKLEIQADVSDPASLSLLAVARDYLPNLLREESRSSAEWERKIESHMNTAQRVLTVNRENDSASGQAADIWAMAFVAFNYLLATSLFWFLGTLFFKRRTVTA